ncbi:MAG: hypothetical protein K2K57_11005 [Oscillospiraceae bacterium]|nr:hypothetical protein [Oscillospiraceae bacterium]
MTVLLRRTDLFEGAEKKVIGQFFIVLYFAAAQMCAAVLRYEIMNVLAAVLICALMFFGGDLRAGDNYADTAEYVEICEEDKFTCSADSEGLYAPYNLKSSPGLMLLSEKEEVLPRAFLDDRGELFAENEREAVRLELEEFSRETGWCVGICTGHMFSGSENIYNGAFGEESGVMLYINKGYAKIEAVGEAAEYVNGERAENILRLTERNLRHESCRRIPSQFGERLIACRKKGKGSFDLYPPAFIIALIFGMAAGFGTVFLISHRYSLSEPPIVNNYLDVRSIEVYRREDKLLSAHSVKYKNNIIQQAVRGEGMFKRR